MSNAPTGSPQPTNREPRPWTRFSSPRKSSATASASSPRPWTSRASSVFGASGGNAGNGCRQLHSATLDQDHCRARHSCHRKSAVLDQISVHSPRRAI